MRNDRLLLAALYIILCSNLLPSWLRRWSVYLQCGRPGFKPWAGKIPWRGKWQSTPVLLPGKSHGQRSLVRYSLWGRQESDMTERLHFTSLHFQAGDRAVMWVAHSKSSISVYLLLTWRHLLMSPTFSDLSRNNYILFKVKQPLLFKSKTSNNLY